MNQIDYKKVFSKLSHIKALSHDQKFDLIVQNLITHTLNQSNGENPKNENELAKKINSIYGISIRTNILLSNVDKLLSNGDVMRDQNSKEYLVTNEVSIKLNKRIEEAAELEQNVKQKWFKDLESIFKEIDIPSIEIFWDCLKTYLCNVFEQHGIQTIHLLNPSAKITNEDQKSLFTIIDALSNQYENQLNREILITSINSFFTYAGKNGQIDHHFPV